MKSLIKILKNNKSGLIILALIIIIAVLLDNFVVQRNKVSNLTMVAKNWKDKFNRNVSKIEAIEGDNFLKIKVKDSVIRELQLIVKENKKKLRKQGSATIISNKTKVLIKTKTKLKYDTIYKKPSVVYMSTFNLDNWIFGNVEAGVNKTIIDLTVKNKYSVVVGRERKGLFSKTKPFAMVTNYNPYTETETLKTYNVSLRKKRNFGIGPVVGIGISTEGKLISIVGIGLQYNIIKF